MKSLNIARWAALAVGAMVIGATQVAAQTSKNALEQVSFAAKGDQVTAKLSFRETAPETAPGFSLANPARIALDFPLTENATGSSQQAVDQGLLRSINVAQASDRMRVVFNLDQSANYQFKAVGKDLYVTLVATGASSMSGAGAAAELPATTFAAPVRGAGPAIRDIGFRRGDEGQGRVVVDIDDASAGVDVRKQGANLIVDFPTALLPDRLSRKLDLSDFSTPVSSVVATQQGGGARVVISPKGNWEHIAYQTESQVVIEVRPIVEDASRLGGGVGRYRGERLSLRFRDYPVKEVLHAFSDFSGFNIVVSEAVGGSISLSLQDVPWDQALDIILEQKNLAMQKTGNVVMIAPREEVIARAKIAAEQTQFEVARDAIFQLNYLTAAQAKTAVSEYLSLDGKGGGALKVMAEAGSNKLFVKAPEAALEDVRRILKEIDLPPRQVLIEARIVEASDTFSRSLGVRLGYSNLNGANVFGSDRITTTDPATGATTNVPVPNMGDDFGQNLATTANVNLPVTGGNALSFFLVNDKLTRLLSLEISALESDGRGKLVSSPRVLAKNGQPAKIEQGNEIPFQQATSSGATSVTFKKATLSLTVTPTINRDGRIALDLKVNKDSIGQVVPGGVAIDTKQVETKVVVDNGGTVVIGGIFEEQERRDDQKVPVLGDLPYVGWLFKQRVNSSTRRELLVFITPRLVDDRLSLQ